MPRRPLLTRDDLPIKPRILQISIRVSDLERSDAFYHGVLGLERRGKYDPQPGVSERFYAFESDAAETLICLLHIAGEQVEHTDAGMGARVMFNLTVPDVESIVDRTVAGGGAVLRETVTRSVAEFTQDMAFVADPDGTTIELTHFS